jgi:predicted amidohydrolase YtcJ
MDLLLLNARVYTQDPAHPVAQAVAISGGRIAAVGTNEQIADLADAAETIDLGGRAVLPGFTDAHVHFLSWALARQSVDLDGAATLDAALGRVAAAVQRRPPDTWVTGRGWNKNLWGAGDFPTRHDLDRVAPANPVLLASKDGHATWLNSRALARAGITAQTPDPPGGRILHDARGEPTGILLETAGELAYRALPPLDVATATAVLRDAIPAAQALGLTGICDLEGREAFSAFQQLHAEGALGLRVSMGIPASGLDAAVELGLRTGFGDETLQVGPLKLFLDGALGPQTAYLLAPYEGRPADRGIARMTPEELTATVQRARRAGIGVAMHAIGDAAVRLALDAAAAARAAAAQEGVGADQLLRIEHAQLVDPADQPRFAQLGVIASLQPIHATSDRRIADRHWGARTAYAYPWRALLAAGATLAFGTDAPVEPLDPLRSLYAAVTRQDERGEPPGGWHPEQRLTLAEAVRAYTLGSAAACRAEAVRGSIEPGKEADLVVLSRDPFAGPPAALLEARVDLTVFAGRVVFAR